MSLVEDGRNAEIVRLTTLAVQAAERGEWDQVIQCYQERGALFAGAPAHIPEAQALLTLDGLVCDRIRTAQSLLQSLIEGAGATRSQLQGLRQKLVAVASFPEHMSLEA